MAKMKVAVAHTLEREEAIDRLQRFSEILQSKYEGKFSEFEESWEAEGGSFRFKAMGFSTSGNVNVQAEEVVVEGKLPIAAMMFKGMIEQQIRDQLNRLLS